MNPNMTRGARLLAELQIAMSQLSLRDRVRVLAAMEEVFDELESRRDEPARGESACAGAA